MKTFDDFDRRFSAMQKRAERMTNPLVLIPLGLLSLFVTFGAIAAVIWFAVWTLKHFGAF